MADGGGNGPVGGPGGADDPELGGLLSRLARSMGPDGVELGGDNVRLEQAPEAGLEVRITLLDDDGDVTSVASILLPSDTPPDAHPDDIPFVRHAPLRVIEDQVRGVTLAMWMLDDKDDEGPDPESVVAAVLRGSREAGWRLETEEGAAGSDAAPSGGATAKPGMWIAAMGPFRLLRGDEVRHVELRRWPTGPMVSLTQRRNVREMETPGRG